jgi:L-cysteate sulfo-lyase
MTLTQHLPRFPLAQAPTPLVPLTRLSAALGGAVNLWIKRDDQTGLALGGNKTRKLEFLVADALAQGADTLVTTGAAQSNHCRQTAAAAVQAGLACHLVLGGTPPAQASGNLLLDQLFDAQLHWTTRENRLNRLAEVAEELRSQGRKPYPITYGGSDPVGAVGYAAALEEACQQWTEVSRPLDLMVIASSSGGTQAGLAAGAAALAVTTPILGISIDATKDELCADVAALATGTAARLGHPHSFNPQDILVNADYLGAGYGIVGDLEREAIKLIARTEGILLDPVYTGRAFGGLLDLIRRGQVAPGANVLFWHTGGQPALFAYAGELT